MIHANRVLVSGASQLPEEHSGFARELGRRLMQETTFVLVTGGLAFRENSSRPALDSVVAEAAFDALGGSMAAANSRIITILPESDRSDKRFQIGSVIRVAHAGVRSRRYSMVLTSDAVIAVNGAKGTGDLTALAFAAGKPLIPVPATGGSAFEAWKKYEPELVQRLHLDPQQALALSDTHNTSRVISTCLDALRRVLRPRCFVAMSFADHPLANTFETIRAVAEDLGFQVIRVDQQSYFGNIIEAIWGAIRNSDLVIADLTGHKPNVYYEMGISHALGKPTLLIVYSRDGTVPVDIPFDVKVQRVVPYGTTQSLQAQLKEFLPNVTAIGFSSAAYP